MSGGPGLFHFCEKVKWNAGCIFPGFRKCASVQVRECENVETVDENYSDLVWRACARPGVEDLLLKIWPRCRKRVDGIPGIWQYLFGWGDRVLFRERNR